MHKKEQELISLDEISAHIQEPVSVERSLAFFEHVHEFKFDDTSQVTLRLVVRKRTNVVKNYTMVLPESVVQKCLNDLDSFMDQEMTSATGRADSIIDPEEEEARRNQCWSHLSCRVFSTTDPTISKRDHVRIGDFSADQIDVMSRFHKLFGLLKVVDRACQWALTPYKLWVRLRETPVEAKIHCQQ